MICIIDMHGKVIEHINLESDRELSINKGSLAPGIYTIRLIDDIESYQINKRMIILE